MEEIFELLGCHLCVKVIKCLSLIEIIKEKNKNELKIIIIWGGSSQNCQGDPTVLIYNKENVFVKRKPYSTV